MPRAWWAEHSSRMYVLLMGLVLIVSLIGCPAGKDQPKPPGDSISVDTPKPPPRDTEVVVVPPPPPPTPPVAAECGQPKSGWLWCDDFEQDRLAKYFEHTAGGFDRIAGAGRNGSFGMRQHWTTGQTNGGALHVAFGKVPSSYFKPVDGGTSSFREIFWRVYVLYPKDWVGGGGDKMTRAICFAGADFSECAIGHVWSGTTENQDHLLLDPASGVNARGDSLKTTQYNDWNNLRWLGQAVSKTAIFDAAHLGRWVCIEAHADLAGTFELWVDSKLEASKTGFNWVGSYSAFGFNAVYFENYWNAGAAAEQDRFMDNVVVSTARIGCLS